jgi:hypothetical protein
MVAHQLVELARMPQRPHQLLELDRSDPPLSGLAALKFDLETLRAARQFKRWNLEQALNQIGGEGFGIPAVIELLSRIYMEF